MAARTRGDRTAEIADILTEKAQEDEKFRNRMGDVVNLQALKESEGWKALVDHFEKGAENYERSLTARLMAGENVSQNEIDYMRGFRAAALAIFEHPVEALNSLERTARRLYAERLRDEVTAELEASPYRDDQEVT